MRLSINDTQHYATDHYAGCQIIYCMQNVVMLSVIILSVVVPCQKAFTTKNIKLNEIENKMKSKCDFKGPVLWPVL